MITHWSDVDILSVGYAEGGEKSEHTVELENCEVLVDYDEDGKIIGIEVMDFKKKLKDAGRELDKKYKLWEKHEKSSQNRSNE